MRLPLCFLLSLIFLDFCPANVYSEAPHIIYILVDDMGWNDVSFHGSDQIPTPNIDALAYQGVILNRHYVQPVCTPSRAALMTGKYPFHTGIHEPLVPSHRVGLSMSEKIMPQYFKEVGYSTHIVGKWHLGFYQKQFTPLARGFDSHFGYWSGAISYYDHIDEDPKPPKGYSLSGHDMRRNYSCASDLVGQYATDLFTEEAVRVIKSHPKDKPLFLYLAHLATHAGNEGKWLEAPQEEINRFSHISNPNRRTYAAMVSKLDQSVGAVVEALEINNMLQNSIVIFVSDNGAPNIGTYKNWGSNYPWRGHKATLWEGALRTPALVWSPLIKKHSRVHNGLMHITDWLPTLLSAAGCDETKIPIDGVNQWDSIARAQSSPRDEVIISINDDTKMYSVIIDNFKYIKGAIRPQDSSEASTFLNLDTIDSPNSPANYEKHVGSSPAWRVLEKYSKDPLLEYGTTKLRKAATVTCDIDRNQTLDCNSKPCLFNLETDPCEQNNIADSLPAFMDHIDELITLYKKDAVPNMNLYADPASNPDKFNGAWSIWEE